MILEEMGEQQLELTEEQQKARINNIQLNTDLEGESNSSKFSDNFKKVGNSSIVPTRPTGRSHMTYAQKVK